MRNFTLKNLHVALTIFVIFIINSSKANTGVIEATFKKNDHDKELVSRQQTTLNCVEYIYNAKIYKAYIESDNIFENAIYAILIVECNSKSVTVRPDNDESKLFKYFNGQPVPMKTLGGLKQLGDIGVIPMNSGWSISKIYLLQADPSECLGAPNTGLIGMAKMCVIYDLPANYEKLYETPCAKTTPIIIEGCPRSNSTDAILIEKLNRLQNRLAEYFAYSEDRFKK
ncbi:15984_t:CDS:1, partial [Acaulospora morrowiae]